MVSNNKRKITKYFAFLLMLFTLFGIGASVVMVNPVSVYADKNNPTKEDKDDALKNVSGTTFKNAPLSDKNCVKNGTANGNRVDIKTGTNEKVYAVEAGTVTKAEWVGNGRGYVVEIQHSNGMTTIYEGLTGKNSVSKGSHVEAGQKIGNVLAQGGSATLSFGVKNGNDEVSSDGIKGIFDGSIAAPTTDENASSNESSSTGTASSGGGSSSSSKDDDTVKEADLTGVSLYDTQTALTAYVNNVVGINGNDLHSSNKVEDPGTVGNAGAYVGYGDVDNDFNEYVMNSLSHGSTTSTYSAWLNTCDGSKSNKNVIYAYTRFGKTLSDAGLDATASVSSVNSRGLMGIIAMGCMIFAQAIPQLFNISLKIMQLLNPFQFLSNASSWAGAFDSGPEALKPIVEWYSHLIDVVTTQLTWAAVVPLMLAFTITSIILLRKPAGTKIMNFVKKLMFIAVGIPLIGGLYTGTLSKLQQSVSNDNAASQIVASTFVDFESWSSNSRLGIPNKALIQSAPNDVLDTTSKKSGSAGTSKVTNNGGVASAKMLRQLRTTAFKINQANNEGISKMADLPSLTSLHFDMTGGMWDENGSGTVKNDNTFYGMTSLADDEDVMQSLMDLTQRFWKNDFYRASDVSTAYANLLSTKWQNDMGHTASTVGSSNNGKVYDMFDQTNTVESWMERESDKNTAVFRGTSSDRHLKWIGKDWNIFRGGTLTTSSYSPSNMAIYTSTGKGLSYQSMYNYLSTSFDENSVVAYSNSKSVSENSKQMHYSVNIVGSGLLKIMYFMNMTAILAVLCLIAFVFTLKMCINNLRRGMTLLGTIPFAAIGMVKSIAQFISYVVAMIMELIISVFMYVFISNMFVVVATAVEQLASSDEIVGLTASILPNILNAVGISSMSVNVVLMVFFETLLVAGLASFIMKYRRAIMRVDSVVSWKLFHVFTFVECEAAYDAVRTGKYEHSEAVKDWFAGLLDNLKVDSLQTA